MLAEAKQAVRLGPVAVDWRGLNAFVIPTLGQVYGVGDEAVDAGTGRGRLVVPFHEANGFFAAPALFPLLEKPVGVGLAKRRAFLLQIRNVTGDLLPLAEEAPQHGIDETGLAEASLGLGQADTLINDGVLGDAVEEENLVQAEPENLPHGRFLFSAFGGALDQPVKQPPPSNAAGDEFSAESGVDA